MWKFVEKELSKIHRASERRAETQSVLHATDDHQQFIEQVASQNGEILQKLTMKDTTLQAREITGSSVQLKTFLRELLQKQLDAQDLRSSEPSNLVLVKSAEFEALGTLTIKANALTNLPEVAVTYSTLPISFLQDLVKSRGLQDQAVQAALAAGRLSHAAVSSAAELLNDDCHGKAGEIFDPRHGNPLFAVALQAGNVGLSAQEKDIGVNEILTVTSQAHDHQKRISELTISELVHFHDLNQQAAQRQTQVHTKAGLYGQASQNQLHFSLADLKLLEKSGRQLPYSIYYLEAQQDLLVIQASAAQILATTMIDSLAAGLDPEHIHRSLRLFAPDQADRSVEDALSELKI